MPNDELSKLLLADAENYDVAAHMRSLLAPHRQVILRMRARYMSYEQIAATLTLRGITIRRTAVGDFCRENFTKAEILRARRERETRPTPAPPGDLLPGMIQTPSPLRLPKVALPAEPGRRGPRIARDDI